MKLQNKKIVIFDWTNLCKRTAFSGHVKVSETEIDYTIFNYSLWNSIYTACVKHKAEVVILAADQGSWRKLVYAPYKLNRRLDSQKKAETGEPTIDWEEFFAKLNKFSLLLADNLPFVYLSTKNCEADDIIGILAKYLSTDNEIIIISGDQDYKQLLKHKNVKLWDPYPGKIGFVKLEWDPDDWINVMSLHGQGKDNIYNVFTRLDFPVEYNVMRESAEISCIRKPFLPEKKAWEIVKSGRLKEWLEKDGPDEAKKKNAQIEKENKQRVYTGKQSKVLYEEDVLSRFNVNKKIISFDEIPDVLCKRVINQLDEYVLTKSNEFYPFFRNMKWNGVLDNYEYVEKVLYRLF